MTADVSDRAWVLAGLRNLARRELSTWWTTRRWWTQALVWTAILVGVLAAMLWVLPGLTESAGGPATSTVDTVRQFPELIGLVMAIGVVLAGQGLILDERRNGVLEWLLSKPVTPAAVVVARFLGNAGGMVATMVALPWIAVHVTLSLATGAPWPPAQSVAAAALLGLVVVFHLSLVLALGALLRSRVAVLALPLVAVVGADLVVGLIPSLFHVSPWTLGALASVVLTDGVMITWSPVVATMAWTAALVVVASLALHRQDG